MFRPVRRKEKEISAEETKEILRSARFGVLALNGDDGYPYAVPVNFFYDENESIIYFHGSYAGHKADALRRDSRVCFTVCGKETVRTEDWAPFVRSAVVFGKCTPIEEREETLHLVRKLAMKYYPEETLVDEEIAHAGNAVRIYAIAIEHFSGKEIQEK